MRTLCSLYSLSRVASLFLACLFVSVATAQKPTDELLPTTTKGYLSVPSPDALDNQFNKTQLGALMRDEAMQPFATDLKRQFREKMASGDTLGLTWADLEGVPTGEVAMATLLPTPTTAATALIAVVKGNEPKALAALAKVDGNMTAKQAKKSTETIAGVKMTIYDVPPAKGKTERGTAVFFLHAGLLVAVDHRAEAEAIARRLNGQANESLSSWTVYKKIRARVDKDASGLVPEAEWFVEPFGYMTALRIQGPQEKKRGKDMLKLLQNQGFTAIQGLGGNVNFASTQSLDILHRTFMYAPAVERAADDTSQDKYDLAARMLDFPNSQEHDPPSWVPRDLATYMSFNAELSNAFEASETLVNELADADVFGDVLEGLKNDPNGPQIDIREELIAHLDQRVVLMTDNVLPITPESERLLVGVQVKDTKAVAAAVKKLMANDPAVKRREHNGHEIWEVVEEANELPEVNVEGFGFDPLENADEEKDEEPPKLFPHASITVIDGWVLLGSHMDILHRVLDTTDMKKESLGTAVDYRLVRAEATKLGQGNNSFQTFSRTDEEYRGTYKLLKEGKMPKSQSLLGKLLANMFATENTPGDEREQRLDATKLPDYQITSRYLGPAGIWVVSEDDGWMITGILLPKQLPVANLKLGQGN